MKKRIDWIDCAKFIAICAVACDHSYGILYGSKTIGILSYFSVNLFILLSGISHMIAIQKRCCISANSTLKEAYSASFKGIKNLLTQYVIATLIIYILKDGCFDLLTYLNHVIRFDLVGAYYFIVFFVEILLVAPIILLYIIRLSEHNYNYLFNVFTVLILIFVSKTLISSTYILKVHGAGQFLFGGTFLVLFYLGGFFEKSGLFKPERKVPIFITGAVLSAFFGWSMCNGRIIDNAAHYFLGEGLNPPGFDSILYSIGVLFFLYPIFFMISNKLKKLSDFFAYFGRHTMVIFLYHTAFLSVLGHFVLPKISSIFTKVLIYICILILPVIGRNIAVKFLNFSMSYIKGEGRR